MTPEEKAAFLEKDEVGTHWMTLKVSRDSGTSEELHQLVCTSCFRVYV